MDIASVGKGSMVGLGGANAIQPSVIFPNGNSAGFFTLWTLRGASQTAGHCGFTKSGGAAAAANYQVPVGKILKVLSVAYAADTTGIGSFQFYYNDIAINIGTAGTPTNPVYQFGASGNYAFPILAANTWQVLPLSFEFPAGKYPGIQAATAPITMVAIVCKLEDA